MPTSAGIGIRAGDSSAPDPASSLGMRSEDVRAAHEIERLFRRLKGFRRILLRFGSFDVISQAWSCSFFSSVHRIGANTPRPGTRIRTMMAATPMTPGEGGRLPGPQCDPLVPSVRRARSSG